IVGPGKLLRRQYEEMVASTNLNDVNFTGFVPPEELPGYYRAADVFCSPALYGESFGIVLIEAMASCVPVVASDIEGYNSV
ncbi:MAG: glycosyltransferase, partial [Dehalococcoidia bacterium]|nr:glycosyltransferase [Dehalococcoidia bacterium]